MSELFRNPIRNSVELVKNYRNELKKALTQNAVSDGDIKHILSNISMENGIYISLNKKYKSGKHDFTQFCSRNRMSDRLPEMFSVINKYGLYYHQEKAVESILQGKTTIISTGTGSGKTESFLIPILDYCLKQKERADSLVGSEVSPDNDGIKALIVYPMNALANDQLQRIASYTENTDISFGCFTGNTPQNSEKEEVERLNQNHMVYRDEMLENPPDILITNYVMLERMISRNNTVEIFKNSQLFKYLVIDEVHTYRGNKAAHLKYLLRRLKYILRNEIVQIASSATLARSNDKHGAYLQGNSLDDFIKPLFDINSYTLIEATYKENNIRAEVMPDYTEQIDYSWNRVVDYKTGIEKVYALAYGRRKQFREEVISEQLIDTLIEKLKSNIFIAEMVSILEGGSSSINDLNSFMEKLEPFNKRESNKRESSKEPYSKDKIRELLLSFLTAITFLNYIAGDREFLDIRVHLFLQNIGGSLKSCIKCRTYHSGNEQVCPECGTPLFYVDYTDVSRCIGKVSGKYLRPKLKDDPPITYYVSLSMKDEHFEGQTLSFKLNPEEIRDGSEIYLEYDRDGELILEYLEYDREKVYNRLINLSPQFREHKYLYLLVQGFLGNIEEEDKKLIGFIDNREKASRYKRILLDEFISDFFTELLKFQNTIKGGLNFGETVEVIKEYIRKNARTEMEHKLVNDLDFWFYRIISIPESLSDHSADYTEASNNEDLLIPRRSEFISFSEPLENYSEIAADLIKIFIRERAIYKNIEDIDIDKTVFLSHHRERVLVQKVIYFVSKDSSEDNSFLYQGISLGNDGRKYREFISKYKHEEVINTANQLFKQGILKKREISDIKEHYYLNPDYLVFKLKESKFRTYDKIRQKYLFFTGLHSSEVKNYERRETEDNFRKGNINFLLTTPTLEMGIDIGNLKNVLMIGVPPLPSNYAQRAGRAGRGAKGNFAVIITFCFENKSHDKYYYNSPDRMIDGLISAPAFDPDNQDIIKKHINAFVLSNYLSNQWQLEYFIDNYRRETAKILPELNKIFPDRKQNKIHLEYYFLEELLGIKARFERNHSRNNKSFAEYLYQHNFFPDYNFSREQIKVYDRADLEEAAEKKKIEIEGIGEEKIGEERVDTDLFYDIEPISLRSPEQAYYKFCPDNTVSIAGNEYLILAEGNYSSTEGNYSYNENYRRSYEYFLAEKQENYLSSKRADKIYQRSELFNYDSNHRTNKFSLESGIMKLHYYQEAEISYINSGEKVYTHLDSFEDDGEDFILDFTVKREALVFEFNRDVFSDERYYVSLASLLDRTIKDEFGLDESGIQMLIDVVPRSDETSVLEDKIFVLLYDNIGNGNVPFKTIFKNFRELVETAYYKLQNCSCDNGCYLCMKSYNTQFYSPLIDKQLAEMITGYLLEKNPFQPAMFSDSVEELELDRDEYNLDLEVLLKGNHIVVNLNGTIHKEYERNGEQNEFIFNTMKEKVLPILNNAPLKVRILSNLDYLVDAFNKQKINKGKEEFAALLFTMLCWKYYKAEKV